MSPGGIPVPVPVCSVPIGGCLTAAGLVTGAEPSASVALRGVVIIIGPPMRRVHSMKEGGGSGLETNEINVAKAGLATQIDSRYNQTVLLVLTLSAWLQITLKRA